MGIMDRRDGRSAHELRTIKVVKNPFGYAPGSVLLEVGNTKVFCTAMIQNGVPAFLRGKNSGWLSAEYTMLPYATKTRTNRAQSIVHRNGRSVEISRLIGRSLRTIMNLSVLQEKTIMVDCDVLQADGGTRTACITGAFFALYSAQKKWLAQKIITEPFLTDTVAAVAVGIVDGTCLLDPSYIEDSRGEADFNFIIAGSGSVIEIQGGAEKKPVSWDSFNEARLLAIQGVKQWFCEFDKQFLSDVSKNKKDALNTARQQRVPLFSLQNRQQTSS